MRDFRILWIVGRPRVGSTWIYNVARQILARVGIESMPARLVHRMDDLLREANAALAEPEARRRWVLKAHEPIDPALPESLYVLPDRDPRDALVSLMRFAHVPFDHALAMQHGHNEISDRFRTQVTRGRLLEIAYRDIVDRPQAGVARLAGFMGIEIAAPAAAEIARLFERDRVGETVRRTEMAGAALLRGGRVDGLELVGNLDGTPRVLDLATGFQAGHVSGYSDGDWRHSLTAGQIEAVEARLGPWLARHGYEPTAA